MLLNLYTNIITNTNKWEWALLNISSNILAAATLKATTQIVIINQINSRLS